MFHFHSLIEIHPSSKGSVIFLNGLFVADSGLREGVGEGSFDGFCGKSLSPSVGYFVFGSTFLEGTCEGSIVGFREGFFLICEGSSVDSSEETPDGFVVNCSSFSKGEDEGSSSGLSDG